MNWYWWVLLGVGAIFVLCRVYAFGYLVGYRTAADRLLDTGVPDREEKP